VEVRLRALSSADLGAAQALLAAACPFDDAATVADEKLFGGAPGLPARPDPAVPDPEAVGAFGGGELIGVAATSAGWLRLLAVHPDLRGRGIGSSLLAASESQISRRGATLARTLDQPGNYLAPGIDERNAEALGWLERRGYRRLGQNANLLIDVATNPNVTAARAAALAGAAGAAGYQVRRGRRSDAALLAARVGLAFSAPWAFEVIRALGHDPPGVHVAMAGAELAGFAAHDGNNRGLGWFGPAGTLEPHRRRGLGEALLLACLVDVAAAGRSTSTVAWVGPRGFYERAAGVAGERRFVVLGKETA
jgi:ribosomal protein S18 acetylase RimI-like enzyme